MSQEGKIIRIKFWVNIYFGEISFLFVEMSHIQGIMDEFNAYSLEGGLKRFLIDKVRDVRSFILGIMILFSLDSMVSSLFKSRMNFKRVGLKRLIWQFFLFIFLL